MDKSQLRKLLEKGYTRENWKQIVLGMLPNAQVFTTDVQQDLYRKVEEKYVESIIHFGTVKLDDGHPLGFYEVKLLPSTVDLPRNKVAIRKAVDTHIKMSGNSGALISFFEEGSPVWRFSFYYSLLDDDFKQQTAHRKRYTYLLGEGETCRTATEQFMALMANEGHLKLEDLRLAFSVDKVSKDFFDEYKDHYQNLVQHLTGKRMVKEKGKWKEKTIHGPSPKLATFFNGNEKDARDFCKKMMGRIVFLYFVQKKGWLGATDDGYTDGRPDFMPSLFRDSGANETFYPTVLAPLFFDTLNNPDRKDEAYTMPDGTVVRVPFLNGGLFEADAIDRKAELLTFPPELLGNGATDDDKRGFLDFLNAFNFTVDEDSPDEHTVAVDPEMLGHIFENLLEDNKDKGAFYTPKPIVHYMCRESLAEYLTGHLTRSIHGTPPDNLGQMVRSFIYDSEWADISQYDRLMLEGLQRLTVCDPAIGSGAFPMGILQEVFALVESIYHLSPDVTASVWGLDDRWQPAKVKLDIIQNSIYGVDIDRGAVDIARLRFWLSLIVDETRPTPLPNLDYKIVVGNSLLGMYNGRVLEIDWKTSGTSANEAELLNISKQLHGKLATYFRHGTSGSKRKLEKQIRDLKIDLLSKQVSINRHKYEVRRAKDSSLFGSTQKDAAWLLETQMQLQEFDNLLSSFERLKGKADAPLDHFDWPLDFAEVMNPHVAEDPGFDIVIANPPYLRVQEIQRVMPELKREIERKYDNARVAWDLSTVFFELAVRLLKGTGTGCFIFPHKFFNTSSAEVFRDYLMKGQYIDKVAHFGANMVFNEADTYTCITQFSKNANEGFMFQRFPFKSNFTRLLMEPSGYRFIHYDRIRSASTLYGTNQWIFLDSEEEYDILGRIYSDADKFEDVLNVFVGLQTSKDDLYVLKLLREKGNTYLLELDCTFKGVQTVKQYELEKTFFKPFLLGRDVHRYAKLNPANCVFFPYLLKDGKAEVASLGTIKKLAPETYKYVMEHEAKFKSRESNKAARMEHWHAYIYPKNLNRFEQPKLSSMEICAVHPNVSIDPAGNYHTTKVYSWVKHSHIKESNEYFLAIANSRLLWWFLMNTGDTLQGDARTFKTNYLNPFPLPKGVSAETDRRFADEVKKVLALKAKEQDARELEQRIDAMVCRLYGLSWQQAQIIAPITIMDRKEYEAIEFKPETLPPAAGKKAKGTVTGLFDDGTLFGQDLP